MRMNNELLGKLGILSVAVVLATAGMSACKGDDNDDATDEVGDGDGDSTGDGDGDGDGDMTGDGDGDMTGDGDGDMTGDGDGDMTGDGDGEPTCATHDPGPGADEGAACYSNNDCASKVCERFQDAPQIDGSCAPTTEECRTRIMGRVLDFTTQEVVEGIDLRVVQALMASTNPVGATALATATSDASGMIDTVSDGQISSPLGIVGLGEGAGYYLTATGLASPVEGSSYGPANIIRDIWVVPSAALSDWSDALETDAAFTDLLPLGEAGGVVGLVRDLQTGDPIANAAVVPTNADTSGAVIRYLDEDGNGFNSDATSSRGVFVIVKPGLGETFGVEIDGEPVPDLEGRAGSANKAIFTLIMNVNN